MAKEGQEDPRWIVKDLGVTGTNVGRWHWSDWDVSGWCQDELKSRLEDLECYREEQFQKDDSKSLVLKLDQVKNVKGDASVMNRKRRLIAIYELSVDIGWRGTVYYKEDQSTYTEATGTIKLPNLESEEDDVNDFEINIELDSKSKENKEHKAMKEIFRKKGFENLRKVVADFQKELRAGANVQEKYKEWEKEEQKRAEQEKQNNKGQNQHSKSVNSEEFNKDNKESTREKETGRRESINHVENFKSIPKEKLFEMFIEPGAISQYTQSKAEIDKKVGGQFSLFNGKIHGEIVELEWGSKLVQKWRFHDWPENVYSNLTLSFEQNNEGDTIVRLKQTNIPHKDKNGFWVKEKVWNGWQEYFFKRIKTMLGIVIGGF